MNFATSIKTDGRWRVEREQGQGWINASGISNRVECSPYLALSWWKSFVPGKYIGNGPLSSSGVLCLNVSMTGKQDKEMVGCRKQGYELLTKRRDFRARAEGRDLVAPEGKSMIVYACKQKALPVTGISEV